MRTSDKGIEFIKSLEGLRLKPYQDIAGHWTVGHGHLLREVDNKRTITYDEAEALLIKDLRGPERSVNAINKGDLAQHEYDALVSLVYNIGAGGFYRSRLRKCLLRNDIRMAVLEWVDWCKYTSRGRKRISEGLFNRRKKEIRLFLEGDYG